MIAGFYGRFTAWQGAWIIHMKDKYIVHFISKTRKKMIRFIADQLEDSELSDLIPTHGNILTALYESGEKLTMNEIARMVSKDKSTVTYLVNNMTKLGYITKENCVHDARITYISLTRKGRAARKPYEKISAKIRATAYKGFSKDEKQELLRLLKKLSQNFSES